MITYRYGLLTEKHGPNCEVVNDVSAHAEKDVGKRQAKLQDVSYHRHIAMNSDS